MTFQRIPQGCGKVHMFTASLLSLSHIWGNNIKNDGFRPRVILPHKAHLAKLRDSFSYHSRGCVNGMH